jgi:hypothetical protein
MGEEDYMFYHQWEKWLRVITSRLNYL